MKVLHLLASDARRGAEVFGSSLVAALDADIQNQVVVLRRGEGHTVSFEAPMSVLQGGWRVPVARIDARTVRSLRSLLGSFRPDAVLAHGGEAMKYAVAADSKAPQRLIYRRIGDASQFGAARTRERAFSLVVRRAARVVAVANVLRGELVTHHGVPRERVLVIPNGVDPRSVEPTRSREDARAALGIDLDANVVLSLGALTWEKNPLAHLRIARVAAAAGSSVVHLIAGDGPLAGEVRAAAAKAAVPTFVLGSRSDVGDLLHASDVMVMASRSEGMPACVIEAGMAGLPVASYALSGIPEVVVDGATGRLAPPGDEHALAGALAELLAHPATRERMGAAARERCLEHFHIRNVARRYAELFQEVTDRRSRQATKR